MLDWVYFTVEDKNWSVICKNKSAVRKVTQSKQASTRNPVKIVVLHLIYRIQKERGDAI